MSTVEVSKKIKLTKVVELCKIYMEIREIRKKDVKSGVWGMQESIRR